MSSLTASRTAATGAADGRPRRRLHDWRKPRWFEPLLFSGGALAVVLIMTIFPFFNTLILSFNDATMLEPGQFIGVDNFQQLFADARFGTALLNSTLYVFCVVPFMVVLPLILASVSAGDGKFMGFFRTSYYLPVVMGAVA